MARKEKKSPKLPKRVAGVKIPRNVRDGLVKLARNPLVADLLAAGLVALAATLRDGSKAEAKPEPEPETEPQAPAPKPVRSRKAAAPKPVSPEPAAPSVAKTPAANGKPMVRATSRTKH